MNIDVVMISRDHNLVVVVVTTTRGPLRVHVDVIMIARDYRRVVRAVVMVGVRFRRG